MRIARTGPRVLGRGRGQWYGEAAGPGSLWGRREEIAAISAALHAAEAAAPSVPSRTEYLLLNHHLSRRILQAHAEWLDEVERKLGPRARRRAAAARGRGRAR